jgi:hypothetical protein
VTFESTFTFPVRNFCLHFDFDFVRKVHNESALVFFVAQGPVCDGDIDLKRSSLVSNKLIIGC